MSAAINHGEQLSKLLKKINRKTCTDHSAGFDPIDQFVYSSLLWDSTHTKANSAFKRIKASTVDLNDFRVGSYEEIIAILGERYPRVSHRAERLRASLNDIYGRMHAVSLDALGQMGKREARALLDSLDGALPFVTARVMLLSFDAHAIPVDDRTHALLLSEGVIEEGVDIPKAAGIIERAVKAADGLTVHNKLQAWSESNGKTKSAAAKAATKKKSSGKNTTAKSTRTTKSTKTTKTTRATKSRARTAS